MRARIEGGNRKMKTRNAQEMEATTLRREKRRQKATQK